MHIKGYYDVENNKIIAKMSKNIINSPAILIDIKYGCIHRIDEADNLKRDYPDLMRKLQSLGSKFTRYIVVIEYDTSQEKVIWNFDSNNNFNIEVHDACTIMNFLTTHGNDAHAIREVILTTPDKIHQYAKILQSHGF